MGYHDIELSLVYKELNTTQKGITAAEAAERLKLYGPNEIREKKRASPLMLFINQFKNILVGILIGVCVIALALGEYVDAIVVFAILFLNALFGFVQEYNAENAIAALKKLSAPKARVIRDGKDIEIPSSDVVPGDVLVLSTGDKIAADARVIESINLQTQEAALTGESLPVKKELSIVPEKTAIGNRRNMLFAQTIITTGRGKAIVTATGMQTEFGHIAQLLQATPEESTPLQIKIGELGKFIGIMTLVICVIVFLAGVLRGFAVFDMLFSSISLAVAAIPEGLPAVVTISLALGVQRMIKRHALIRRLPSVETLGATTVICTDKTGTLTHNEMTVTKLYVNQQVVEVSGSGYSLAGSFSSDPKQFDLLLRIGALNNDAKLNGNSVMGDPTEGCLIVSAAKAGLERQKLEAQCPRVDEIPFDSVRKRMTTIHKVPKGTIAYTKGAPDVILKLCTKILIDGKERPLTPAMRKQIIGQEEKFADQALRVLGFAYKDLPKSAAAKDAEKSMVFVGLQAMIDPPRAEVKQAIAKCRSAGIKVVMVTGDYKTTAQAIARELGIEGDAITGEELDALADLDNRVEQIGIYARVNPEHKMKIIEAFRKRGHIVAMTGDGVNDAPALKKADIGISMGVTGTDVAREASDMILTDDNFESIVNAVEEGRGIYDNIRKFVKYLLSCNIGEVFTVFLAIIIGMPLPLLPIQILWVNLATDGLPALALGVDPIEKDVMRRNPRKTDEHIMPIAMIVGMLITGAVICAGTLGLFSFYQNGDLRTAQTVAFTTLVMFQLFNVLNCRSEHKSIFAVGLHTNMFVIGAIATSVLLQLAVLYTPLRFVFDTVPLTLLDWGRILLVSLSVIAVAELIKLASKNGRT